MGFRFRKSINLGGAVRINVSKSGIGGSIGGKGARITKKANGGTRTTTSIPGTGISYVEETGKKSRSKSKTTATVSNVEKVQAKREKVQAQKPTTRTIVSILIFFAYIAIVSIDCACFIALATAAGFLTFPGFFVLTIFVIVRAIVNGKKRKKNKKEI